jgi:two-component system cell cycle response regulator
MTARVLVVDDIAANVRLLEAKLLVEYYEVVGANDGPTALKLVKERAPDIVLLDVMMPGMDGYAVCRRIKADPETAHIPVVMVTALSETADRVRGLEAGADDFLTKPVNDVALFARIRSLVRLKRACDEWRTREATSVQFGIATSGGEMPRNDEPGSILLVRDPDGLTDSTIERLKAQGHQITAIEGADLAMSTAASAAFDLILLNDRPGGGDALRLCSQLRSNPQTRPIPILLTVQDGDVERLAKALELGVNDYLVRPVDRDELIARTRTQIRRKRFEDGLRNNYERSLTAALTDTLTGLSNRRYLETHFGAVNAMLAAASKPIALLVLDVDHFKSINDRFGHTVGDQVLKGIAQRMQTSLRNFDTAIRYGGEEFVLLMPNTVEAQAMAVAERLCVAVREAPIKIDDAPGEVPVTVSIGVTTGIAGKTSLAELVKAADAALYEAKRTGRNKIVGTTPAPQPARPALQAIGSM